MGWKRLNGRCPINLTFSNAERKVAVRERERERERERFPSLHTQAPTPVAHNS